MRQCKRKQRSYNRSKKSGKPEHKAAYSRSHKSVQSALRQARWRYIKYIIQVGLDDGRSKQFWDISDNRDRITLGYHLLK